MNTKNALNLWVARFARLSPLRVVLVCGFIFYAAVSIDHVYMVNGRYYPEILSTRVNVASNGDAGIAGFTALCGGRGGWEFYNKENGQFMRCTTIITGAWGWPKTYLIENMHQLSVEAQALYGKP